MYYDMSGFDYGILDVVQVLHLRKRRGNYYDCPFCGETHGKLNINVEKNVFRCNRCDASGGMLKLYADLHNVTLSEANQQIREALGKGEYRTDYIKATPVQEEKATAELAPIEEIHRTYQRMLSMLTLNRKHQEDLQRRGLKPEQIEAQRYRSVPLFGMKKLVKRLAEEGYMVKGVPGFYRDTDGNWTINFKAENSGILIPIVSLDGFIQGFQIRVDHVTDTKKYIWLSSVNYDQGVSSGSPVHVIGDLAAERVYLTEGALKGTIAHYLSGATFVCVAGVNQYRNLKPVLERMKGYGMKQLLEATLNIKGEKKPLVAKFYGDKNGKIDISNQEQMQKILDKVKKSDFGIESIKKSEKVKKSPLPFTTSTLQQEAAKTLNMSTKRTMNIAQQLYEGVDIKGRGTIGLITYLRTDSTRVADEAKVSSKEYIGENYGEKYLPQQVSAKKDDKKIQDAHEAIRPTDLTLSPAVVKESLQRDQFRLYQLIWKRFVASQMALVPFISFRMPSNLVRKGEFSIL